MDNEDGSNTITVSIRRFDDARSVWYPEDVKKIGQFIKRKCDRFGWTVDKNVEYRLGITDFYITEIESSDDVVKESSGDDDDYARFAMSDLTDGIEKYLKSNKDALDLESVERVMDYNTSLLLTFNTGNKIKISFDDEID